MRIKRIQAAIIAGLLLLTLILPQLALAAGPDITVGPVPLDLTSVSVTIYFTTNTYSIGCVFYSHNTSSWTPKCDLEAVATHYIQLTDLRPSTTYYYWIRATDASGSNVSDNGGLYYNFTTGPPTFSITLNPVCGVCGELVDVETCQEVIEATAIVGAAGTYHICWDSRVEANVVGTFTATAAGSYIRTFYLPEAKKGIHTVYLTDSTYAEKEHATFEVLPSVKIDPEEGPVGRNVTLNGYGFGASQNIRVSFLGTVIKTGTANTVGSWDVSYTIPPTPAGGYTFEIEAKEGTIWAGWVNKYFEVTPQITVTPSSATVGQTMRVDGTGFASDEEDIKVTFDEEVLKENICADEDGSWSVTMAVPPVQSGRYVIDASGASTRARDVDDVKFTVGPGILVKPISAYVGAKITVAGGGFASRETGIKLYFDGKVVTPVAITADISGCWESSFTLEASTYGSHTVSASGDITQPAVTNTLTTQTKIEDVSPVEGAPGDSVTLTGSGFSDYKKLTVTIGGKSAELGDARSQANGNVLISFAVPASTAGKQTVEVRDDGGATASSEFTVKKKVLTTPQPISPENNSKLRSGQITFRWGGTASNSSITYILQISDSPDVATYVQRITTETPTCTLPKEDALPRGTYYWWVKAVDDYGNESLWSSPSSFTVSPIPTWVWVVVGLVVLVGLMVVAYRETKFKVTE